MQTTKIVKIRSLGVQDTYSPEMASFQHNYILDSGVVHRNSHGVSYCLQAFRCLFLKGHFPAEWWASVLSSCVRQKMIRYMNIARSEGVTFDTLNANNLTMTFTATGDVVNPGMITIKKLGKKAARKIEDTPGPFSSFEDFVEKQSVNKLTKVAYERLIKLGTFKQFCPNSQALWMYYQCRYLKSTEANKLRKAEYNKILSAEGWTESKIVEERKRQLHEYFKLYPKRKKVPPSIANWAPKCSCDPADTPTLLITIDHFTDMYPDYTLPEILAFEKEYLGYYLNSPLDVYKKSGGISIGKAIERSKHTPGLVAVEVVISNIEMAMSKNKTPYARVIISDGVQEALMFMWERELEIQDEETFKVGVGVKAYVEYDPERKNFVLGRGKALVKLAK